jgi:hypothetical protein
MPFEPSEDDKMRPDNIVRYYNEAVRALVTAADLAEGHGADPERLRQAARYVRNLRDEIQGWWK